MSHARSEIIAVYSRFIECDEIPAHFVLFFFFFNDPATPEFYPLSLHDALPISLYASGFSGFYLPLMIVLWLLILRGSSIEFRNHIKSAVWDPLWDFLFCSSSLLLALFFRSEEHTSELQSQSNLVCRLLLEKKKQ